MKRTPILTLLMIAATVPAFSQPAPAPARPRLAVLIVLDQFRYDYLERFASVYDAKSGAFARFRRDGALFSDARYGHATTHTGPGHAHIATGAFAYQTGMVGNRWFDRASGKVVPIAGDPDHHWLGGPGDETEGSSPRNLIGTTLGDELVLASQGRSKVVAVALKCRSAVLLAGKLGRAWWLNEKHGGFVTSDYYAKELPAWVIEWNAKRLADTWFGKEWTPIVPAAAFADASADDLPEEGDIRGLGRSFPHRVTGKLDRPGEDYYDALTKTPFANELELDFARATIEAEGLGNDNDPDLLAISISATDEVGHTFGPFSREVMDMAAQTDRQLGAFLVWLDKKVPGATVVLTADHGASPTPEYMARLGIEAHRIKRKTLKDAVEAVLDARHGDGDWVLALEDPSLYLNLRLIAERKLDPEEVERTAAEALESVPGVLNAYTRDQLRRGENGGTEVGRAYQVAFYPARSGDLLIATKPYSFWGKYAEYDYGTSHGSPYSYDTHVPLALLGPGVVPGLRRNRVSIADLAPTLAALLGVLPPPAAEGRVLDEALRTPR